MTKTRWTPAGCGMQLTRARRWSPWHEAAGLLALAAALGLWAVVTAGVVAPLGDALARLEEPPPVAAPPACPTPPDAFASAARPPPAPSCP